MKFQFSEKKVKLPGNVHAYAEKKVMNLTPGSREGVLVEVTLTLSFKRCAGTGRGHSMC